MTTFVDMYHPLIPSTASSPVHVAPQAVDDYEARGWLELDPQNPPPVIAPYLTQAAGDSRYLPVWRPQAAVVAGQVFLAPDGQQIQRTADGTTRATYDATEAALWSLPLRAALVPKWKPSTAYVAATDFVLNPSGQIVQPITDFTSGTTYNSANWTIVSGGGGVDATAVHLAGAETITGVKTFSASPIVPTPTTSGQASPKSYVDSSISALTLPTSTTKRVDVVLGGPGTAAGGALTQAGGGMLSRYKATLVVKPTRYRVRIKNFSTALQTVGGALTLNAVAVAAPAFTNATGDNRWTGDTAAGTPVSLTISNTVIDGTSTDTITDWQTNAGEISAYTPFTVSVAVTNPNAPNASIYNDAVAGYGYINSNAGAASNALATSPVGSKVRTPYLDVRLEVEYATLLDVNGRPNVPVGLIIGDSITSGLTGDATLTASSLTQEETWPGQASLRNRFVGINLGIAQKTAQNFVSNWAAYTTSRVDLTTTVPDFALIDLGINDVKGGVTAATLETALMAVIADCRALGIQRIYLCTMVPGGWAAVSVGVTGTTTSASAVVTAIPSTYGMFKGMAISGTGIPASTTILSVDSPTQVTMSANATATATAVAITVDKSPSAYMSTTALEAVRLQVNTWARHNPYGIQGIFDFDEALRLETQPGMADPAFISTYPHPDAAGYTRMGSTVAL